jgi:hypothetical protein
MAVSHDPFVWLPNWAAALIAALYGQDVLRLNDTGLV